MLKLKSVCGHTEPVEGYAKASQILRQAQYDDSQNS